MNVNDLAAVCQYMSACRIIVTHVCALNIVCVLHGVVLCVVLRVHACCVCTPQNTLALERPSAGGALLLSTTVSITVNMAETDGTTYAASNGNPASYTTTDGVGGGGCT